MKTYIQRGHEVDIVTPAGGLTSGQGYLVGNLFGIVSLTTVEGEKNVLSIRGVFILTKPTAIVFLAEDKMFWDDKAKKVTTDPTGNHYIGTAVEAAGSSDTEAKVLLNSEGLNAPARYVTLVAPTGGVVKGTGYIIGNMFVVAMEDKAQTLAFKAQVGGEAILPKNTSQSITQGLKLYWKVADVNINTTASGNWLIGMAVTAQGSSDTTVRVLLDGITTFQEA